MFMSRNRVSDNTPQLRPSPFLGSMPTDNGTQEATLPPRFAALAAGMGDLFDDYREGHIGAEEFATSAAALIITDARGFEWTIGTTSGQWYRRELGSGWEESTPPLREGANETADPLAALLGEDIEDRPTPQQEEVVEAVERVDRSATAEPQVVDPFAADPYSPSNYDRRAVSRDVAPEPERAVPAAESDPEPELAPESEPEPAAPVARGSQDDVWGDIPDYDPNQPDPHGIDTDGISGSSVWLED